MKFVRLAGYSGPHSTVDSPVSWLALWHREDNEPRLCARNFAGVNLLFKSIFDYNPEMQGCMNDLVARGVPDRAKQTDSRHLEPGALFFYVQICSWSNTDPHPFSGSTNFKMLRSRMQIISSPAATTSLAKDHI